MRRSLRAVRPVLFLAPLAVLLATAMPGAGPAWAQSALGQSTPVQSGPAKTEAAPKPAEKKPAAPKPAEHKPADHKPAERKPAAHPAPAHPGAAHPTPVVKSPHGDKAKPATPSVPVPVTPEAPAAPAAAPEPPKGSVTGLPLPRFVALKTDEVNLRAGPGTRYPIDWVYKRRDLPVEIQREFDVWRLVQMPDGTKGWVHEATLMARRGFIVTGGDHDLRAAAADTAGVVAMLKQGVVGRLRNCAVGADWCQVQVGTYRGWLKRSDFWGSYPGEAIQ